MADARPESNPWLNATGWLGIAITALGLILFIQGGWYVVTPVQLLGAAVVVGGLVICAAAMAVTAICWHFDHRRG